MRKKAGGTDHKGDPTDLKGDLTEGPVFATMLLFALPMIFGNLLQQGYNVVDTWVVGHFVGSGALAAVGSAFALMTFLTSALLGLCMGSGIVFSLCFGRRDGEALRRSLCASFVLVTVTAALLTAAALAAVEWILNWLNIPPEITDMTREYLVLVFAGIPAIALYNYFAAYLKAIGNSLMPLAFLGLSTVLNIGLDLLFVAVWGRGTAGAAQATVIAQYVSGAGIAVYVLAVSGEMRSAFRHFRVRRESLLEIANYSLLTCLQQSVMNLGILMVQGLVNSFGTAVMAAFAAATKIDAFAYMPLQEYGNAFSTFVAQNIGAGRRERVREGLSRAFLSVILYCAAAGAVLWVLAEPLMRFFISGDEMEIIAEGVRVLHTLCPFYFGIGCLFLFYGLYRAIGRPALSVVLTVVSLGTRVALAYLLSSVPGIGVAGIWWSIPIGWALADSLGALFLRRTVFAGTGMRS
ncbi:MAG: MATE family efflux transporter [Eubacteriales bacterium]|nr:MATE family efflux transporter [Eubacteriales bacterium]